MNLSILLTDFIDTKGMLKTYRFIPINQYNRIVVDRLSDICTDVKGNTERQNKSMQKIREYIDAHYGEEVLRELEEEKQNKEEKEAAVS